MVELKIEHITKYVPLRARINEVLTKDTVGTNKSSNLSLIDGCIDYASSIALNTINGYGQIRDILVSNDDIKRCVISAVDAQLILKIFFRGPVTMHYISFSCDRKPQEMDASQPKTMHIFTNRPELDFLEADHIEPLQKIVLDTNSINRKHRLSGTKFSNITNIQLYIVDNIGNKNHTFINELVLWGCQYKKAGDW